MPYVEDRAGVAGDDVELDRRAFARPAALALDGDPDA
jgi:hypothetical protein